MRRIAFFEDGKTTNFSPIALLRPVFELLCGHFTTRERCLRVLLVNEWGALMRPELAEVYREEHPECRINDFRWLLQSPVLLVNGRWLAEPRDLAGIEPGTAGWIGDELAYLALEGNEKFSGDFESLPEELLGLAFDKKHIDLEGTVLQYPWDLISENGKQNTADFAIRDRSHSSTLAENVAIVGPSEKIYVDPTAEIDPFVVLDSTHGPIWIDAKAKIQAFTRIAGPTFIGRQSQTFRANIREGTSIGPVCRVGGEIEESIIHGFANKYHDGFLGHSYVCPWVNLGALTTNSDLKNDYSSVSVPIAGERVDSGSTKVGCFIGDHTKTALCSLFNTGSSIGIMSLILPGGELLPKHIPSFTRIWHGHLEPLPDDTTSALATAKYAMGRRDCELTPAMERLVQTVFTKTKPERDAAFDRWQRMHAQSQPPVSSR